jgi:hypothetical protein
VRSEVVCWVPVGRNRWKEKGTKVQVRTASHLYLLSQVRTYLKFNQIAVDYYRISLPSRFFNEANIQKHHHVTRHVGTTLTINALFYSRLQGHFGI